jgi:cell shape-determining protein MreC
MIKFNASTPLYEKIHSNDISKQRRQFAGSFQKLFFGDDTKEENNELPEVDWNKLNVEHIQMKASEVLFTSMDMNEILFDCVEKCLKIVNPDRSWRDKCIAKTCDIY